jgi:hypothetical protein
MLLSLTVPVRTTGKTYKAFIQPHVEQKKNKYSEVVGAAEEEEEIETKSER